jgi:hypothetical protein
LWRFEIGFGVGCRRSGGRTSRVLDAFSNFLSPSAAASTEYGGLPTVAIDCSDFYWFASDPPATSSVIYRL